MKKYNLFGLLIIVALMISFVSVSVVDAEDIKSRMAARLPDIVALKANGIVGENNQGFLDFVGSAREKEDVVSAENSDRSAVYGAIAQQQSTTPALVGLRRAQQIADNADPGEWLQDGSGNWYKK